MNANRGSGEAVEISGFGGAPFWSRQDQLLKFDFALFDSREFALIRGSNCVAEIRKAGPSAKAVRLVSAD